MARLLVALALAAATAALVDGLSARRGLLPPGFADPRRRLLAGLALAFVLFVGVFVPAASFDVALDLDLEAVGTLEIFSLHLLLLGSLAAWYGLGFVAVGADARPPTAWADELGLRARDVPAELALGLAAGVVAWAGVLAAAVAAGSVFARLAGEDFLGQEPAEVIVWMASLPVAMRLAISAAAGVAEELFFRGFLQPRVGIAASTALFVGAHLGYGQPFMLFGITLLSLFYAWLVKWRRSVWSAMAAHFLFDAVQLLLIIPLALEAGGTGSPDFVLRVFGIC